MKVYNEYDLPKKTPGEHRPLVSVTMTAYNHERTIARALDSVLMQEVDFDYEILIGEDGSSDSTREIITRYCEKYPDIIKPIFYEKNVGMKQNYLNLRECCKGIYRTTLEGDDYWLTVDRMKRMVDFLENNPDYIGVGYNWYTVNEKNRLIGNPFESTYFHGEIFTYHEAEHWLLPRHTCAVMYRNIFYDYDPEIMAAYDALPVVGDRKISLFLSMHGKYRCFDDYIAAREIVKKSGSSYYATTKRQNMYYVMYHWTQLLEEFIKTYFDVQLDYSEARLDFWLKACKAFFTLPCKMHFKVCCDIYNHCGDKKAYRRALTDKIRIWARRKYSSGNPIKTTGIILKKILHLPKRVWLFNKKTRAQRKAHPTSIKNFV